MTYALCMIMTMMIVWGYGWMMYTIGKSHGMDRMIVKVAKAEGIVKEDMEE